MSPEARRCINIRPGAIRRAEEPRLPHSAKWS
jgi:hypothetical protein